MYFSGVDRHPGSTFGKGLRRGTSAADINESQVRSVATPTVSRIVVLIVGFRSADDIANCVAALQLASAEPPFEVLVIENGGPDAMEELLGCLTDRGLQTICSKEAEFLICPEAIRQVKFSAARPATSDRLLITVAETAENLGYAGAINAYLRALLEVHGWEGVWILNPDTEPTPTALGELVACSNARQKGMVGSRITTSAEAPRIHSRGLAWNKFAARTVAIDYRAPVSTDPDLGDVESRLDAPSGASLFVTRRLIEQIGLMDERFFLYFEDLDWGQRAREFGGVGYAHASIVPHRGGSTTRVGETRRPSCFSSYLEFRNRILFVRKNSPLWLPWTIVMQFIYALFLMKAGSPSGAMAAAKGLLAGILGEVGRPDRIMGPKGWHTDG
jgi:N-acetylglucosaminyl-diphospho-decaprenol L-rhamnosyltransferase